MTNLFTRPDISTPLSYAIGLPDYKWRQTKLGQLHEMNKSFWVREVPDPDPELCWRVVDIFIPDEDTTVARYWCYDQDGHSIAHPDIFVEGANKSPVDAQIALAHDGGYTAWVRSPYPSEGFSHGFIVVGAGVAHKAPVICWRLFSRDDYARLRAENGVR